MSRGKSGIPVYWNVCSGSWWRPKLQGKQDLKSLEQETHILLVRHQGSSELKYFFFHNLIPRLVGPGYEGKPYYLLDADSQHIFCRTLPQPDRVIDTIILSFIRLFQYGGEYGKNSGFHVCEPTVIYFCCEISSLVRNGTPWNNMTVDTALFLSVDGRFGRHIMDRKGT